VIQSDDHVILFLQDRMKVSDVERLFSVGVTFFG
jgi:trk system potassium uptake protein TrkA